MTRIQRGAVIRTANAWDGLRCGTLTATVAPVQLETNHISVMEIIIQNDPDSGEAAFVGDRRRQAFQLSAGASVTLPVNDLSLVYVRSAGGTATVNWLAGE